jgi:regulator of sigma E protease
VQLVWFILLIGGLITVHELGHFVAARLLDVKVLKVGIGFGPALWTARRGDTEWALCWIPLGGYVRLLGEDGPVAVEDRPRAFSHRSPWQRLVVILAGPAANLLFPIFLFVHLYAGTAQVLSPTIGAVFAGQPAAEADLRPGDRVTLVDGEPVATWEELNDRVLRSAGRELRLTVERSGVEHPLERIVTPREHLRTDAFGARERIGLIGVAPHFRMPQVGVEPGSAAERAGLRSFDVITSVQGRPISSAEELEPLLYDRGRSGSMLLVTFDRPGPAAFGFAALALLSPATAQIIPDAPTRPGHYDFGLRPADPYIHEVEPGSPASAIGLAPGDSLTLLDGAPVAAWEMFAQALEERPLDEHVVAWRDSAGAAREARFHLQPRRALDEYHAESTLYVFGASGARAIEPVPAVTLRPHLWAAFGKAVERALSVTAMLVRVLGLTVMGRMPSTALGGPLLVYQVAGVAAQHGAEQFLVMAALISLNLALLNLLPVPLLDGGQATLVILEAVRRRPVSARTRERATYVGVALLAALLLLASRNDLRNFLQ